MEHFGDGEQAYSMDASSESLYGVEVNMDFDSNNVVQVNEHGKTSLIQNSRPSSSPEYVDAHNMLTLSAFGSQLQELVIRALMQSTASLVGPPPGFTSVPQDGSTAMTPLTIEEVPHGKTWQESTYHIGEARWKRKTAMTRTSAGEGSDSQEDFPIPENESPQEKSLRSRRLNRYRSRRANELSNNRKAIKKLPYVVYVDGTGKAKGIHKHLWRAAVRGQCGHLDPTMDSINHHPKHVVDSIWHALEKEWEFEGFAHRAREMFERSATKCMRNQKMQLKYKCLKDVGGRKPDDVSGLHWSKIVEWNKNSTKQATSSSSRQSTVKGKESILASQKENIEPSLSGMVPENNKESAGQNTMLRSSGSFPPEDEDVDARIKVLQTELLRLQKSRGVAFLVDEAATTSEDSAVGKGVPVVAMDTGVDMTKVNRIPRNGNAKHLPQGISERTTGEREEVGQLNLILREQEMKSSSFSIVRDSEEDGSGIASNVTEMDCGDVVRMFAFTGGRKEEIGKAIVMGLAGSKYARVDRTIEEPDRPRIKWPNYTVARYAFA